MTNDEMVGWHYQPNGHELDQTLGDSELQTMESQTVQRDLASGQQQHFLSVD